MEDKIEVNEYVRTDRGEIAKVTSVAKETLGETLGANEYRIIGFCNTEPYVYGNIVKHSKQLIDLIEVGDIVKDEYNKYEVAFVKDDKIYCNDYNLDDSLITLREQDIKAILTKEQMEDNCYKVGGEDGKRNIYRDTVTYNDNRANIIG